RDWSSDVCSSDLCPQRRKCFTLSKRSRTIVTDLDPRVRFLSPNQGGTIPAGGSRRPCAATAAGPTATPAPLVAAGALPRPRPVPYRSDRRRRERRVLHARDVLDDPDDLAGVAELVVVPEVEDRVVALDLQGARVHDRRVARADEVAGDRVGGADEVDLALQRRGERDVAQVVQDLLAVRGPAQAEVE